MKDVLSYTTLVSGVRFVEFSSAITLLQLYAEH